MRKDQLNLIHIVLSGAFVFLLLLIGCQTTIGQDTNDVLTSVLTTDEQEAAPLATMTIASTRPISQTASPVWTPVPSSTSSPIPQPTPTPSPTEMVTSTPWPTLSPDEAADKVLSLLADNQNPDCLLPCWWGATPGQTRWQDIEPFLRSFATQINETSIGASAKLPLPETVAVPYFDYYVSYSWDELGIIRGLTVTPMNISGYDPATMMALYGIPDEVWLYTFSELLPGDVLPFRLLIVYQEKGISFRYYVNATGTYETITACFEPGAIETERPDIFPAGPIIRAWVPGEYKTVGEIVRIPGETYFPLEEKTDLTPATLHEKFTSLNESPCIDTPAELWRIGVIEP